MSEIPDHRQNIDHIDPAIVRAIASRVREGDALGKEKKQNGNAIEDKTRETEVLSNAQSTAEQCELGDDFVNFVVEFYEANLIPYMRERQQRIVDS